MLETYDKVYVTNWNGHKNFSKKSLKYEISKAGNPFESKPNTDIYLSTFTALKKSYRIARC